MLGGSNGHGFIHGGRRTDPSRLVQEVQRQRHVVVRISQRPSHRVQTHRFRRVFIQVPAPVGVLVAAGSATVFFVQARLRVDAIHDHARGYSEPSRPTLTLAVPVQRLPQPGVYPAGNRTSASY